MNGESFSSSLEEITKITLYQLPLLYGIMSLLVGLCFTVRKTSIFNTNIFKSFKGNYTTCFASVKEV